MVMVRFGRGRLTMRLRVMVCICVGCVWSSVAQEPAAIADGSGGNSAPDLLEKRLDGYFAERMEEWFVPGAVCVVFGGGQTLYRKGLGVESLESKTPVDPDNTVFYLASVGKLATAIGALQLAEQGRLDFREDVSRFVPGVVPADKFLAPITLHHLLTHTPGLDDRIIGYSAPSINDVLPLRTYLERRMPPRVMEPGKEVRYSNHGFGLAGLAVAEAGDTTFTAYVQGNILGPLGMERSTSGPAPSAETAGHLAQGYWASGDDARLVYSHVTPAGALFSTGGDMEKLMRALAGVDQNAALSPWIRGELMRQQFTHRPELPGYGYAMYQRRVNGIDGWEIAGAVPGFAAAVFIAPEKQLGVFVALNRQEPEFALDVVPIVVSALYDAPNDETIEAQAPGSGEAWKFAGTYRPARNSKRSIEKLAVLFQVLFIETGDGRTLTLEVPGRLGMRRTVWSQVDEGLFRKVGGNEHLAFGEDRAGNVTHLYSNEIMGIPWAYERVPQSESPLIVLPVLAALCGAFAFVCIAVPLAAGIGRIRRKRGDAHSPRSKVPWCAALVSAMNLAFAVGIVLAFSDVESLATRPSATLYVILTLPFLSMLACAVMASVWIRERGLRRTSMWATACAGLTLAATLGFHLIANGFNLVGYKL